MSLLFSANMHRVTLIINEFLKKILMVRMATSKRIKTKYPGVYYREADRLGGAGIERVYYVLYKRDGKLIETKVGRQFVDDMTPARAALIRGELLEGKRETRKEVRETAKIESLRVIWTIQSLWDEYKRRNPDLKGIVTDQNRFDLYISTYAAMEPQEITATIVDNLRLSLAASGKKPGTIKNVLELLRRIISFGVKKGLVGPEQARTHFEMPKLNNERTEDLTAVQLSALMEAIGTTKYKKAANMMLLALYTGMRRGEMFNLKWEHIDWVRGFIYLVGKDDGLGAKSGQSERIPLNEMAQEVLTTIARTASPYVFPGRNGSRMVDIRKQADALKKEAGLPEDFRPFHGLRHVYASMLASSGKVSMYELQRLMTHKSPVMTQRYAHLRDDALKKASEVAKDVISSALIAQDL